MTSHLVVANQTATIMPTTHPEKEEEFRIDSTFITIGHVAGGLIFGIIIVLGIAGNVIVVLAVRKERKLQTRANYLIGSLAIADLLVSMIVSPFSAFMALRPISSPMILKRGICHIFIFLDVTCCTASILHLCTIAWVRYRRVSTVRNVYSRRFNAVLPTIAGIWIAAALVSIAPHFMFPNTTHSQVDYPPKNVSVDWKGSAFDINNVTDLKIEDRCIVNDNRIYRIVATTLAFYGPLLVILIIYMKMAHIAWSRINPRHGGVGNNFRYQHEKSRLRFHDSSRRLETTNGRKISRLLKTKKWKNRMRTANEQESPIKGIKANSRNEIDETVGKLKLCENNSKALSQTIQAEEENSQDYQVTKGHLTSASCTDIPHTNEQSFLERQTFSCSNLVSTDLTTRSKHRNYCTFQQKNGEVCDVNGNSTSETDGGMKPENLIVVEYTMSGNKTTGIYLPDKSKINSAIDPLTASGRDKENDHHYKKEAVSTPGKTAILLSHNSRKATSLIYCRGQLKTKLTTTTPKSIHGRDIYRAMLDDPSCTVESTVFNHTEDRKPAIDYHYELQRNSSPSKIMSIKLRKERRVIRTLGMVIGAFVLCWLPFFAKEVILPFCKEACYLSPDTEIFINWLGYANSALNPFIYAYSNRDFSRAFRRILREL